MACSTRTLKSNDLHARKNLTMIQDYALKKTTSRTAVREVASYYRAVLK